MSRFRISVISVLSTAGHFRIYEVPPSRRGAGRRKKFGEEVHSYTPTTCENFSEIEETREVFQINRTSLTERLLIASAYGTDSDGVIL